MSRPIPIYTPIMWYLWFSGIDMISLLLMIELAKVKSTTKEAP